MLRAPAGAAWNAGLVRREALLSPAVGRAMESEGPRAPGVRWVQFLARPPGKVLRMLEVKVQPAKELLEPREPQVLELRERPVLEPQGPGLLEQPERPVLELREPRDVQPWRRQRVKVLARRRVRLAGHDEEVSAIPM